MRKRFIRQSVAGRTLLATATALPLLIGTGVAAASSPASQHHSGPAINETDLVSDLPGRGQLPPDPSLVNPWGLALSPTSPIWSANNGADNATLYSGPTATTPVAKVPLTVPINNGAPTGQAFNSDPSTTDFVVHGPNGSGAARFIFDSEAGDITAWNPTASPTALTQWHVDGAIFKGLAQLNTKFGSFLLAADFHHGKIDVFDSNFHPVKLPKAFFHDPRLPRGYAPFNVAVLGDSIYVTYAKQDANAEDEVDGARLGIVDQYLGFGLIPRRIATHGTLNAPWGLATAPASFGKIAGDLLVGNFGDGRINIFDKHSGAFRGQLKDSWGKPITIDGLWSLTQGTAATGGTDALWFSAGIDHEQHGLLGLLRPAA